MLTDDQITHLVLSLEARTDKLDASIAAMTVSADRQFKAMEQRSDLFAGNIEKAFARSGHAVRSLAAAFGVGISIEGAGAVIESLGRQAELIEQQTRALGISSDAYQQWVLSARKAGIEQDQLNTGLDFFSKNVGLAQLKQTAFGKELSKLGVDLKDGPEKAFYDFMDAVSRTTDVEQRNALITLGMGRGSVELAAFMAQGSAALREQGAQFEKNGEIIDKSGIAKLVEMQRAWTDMKAELTAQLGATVVSGLADDFKHITDEIKDPQFQEGLKNFASDLAEAAIAAAKFASVNWKAIAEAYAGMRIGGAIAGPGGAAAGALLGFGMGSLPGPTLDNQMNIARRDVETLKSQLASEERLPSWAQTPKGWLGSVDDLTQKLTAAQAKLKDLYQQRDALIGPVTVTPKVTQPSPKTGAGIDLSGSLGHETPDWLQPVKVTPRVERTPEQQAALRADDQSLALISAGQKSTDALRQEAGALGLTGGAAEAYAYRQKALNDLMEKHGTVTANDARIIDYFAAKIQEAGDALQAQKQHYQDQVALTDELRSGLENIGEAGLHGFSSMRDAAKQFLEQLAEMILKLYVLQPMMNALFGQQGTAGGGLFGSAMSSVFGGSSGGIQPVTITPAVNAATGAASTMASSAASSGWFSDALSWIGSLFADGGIMTSRGPVQLRSYAGGGIANSPQLAVFGEGSSPEAYVPVPSGRIPVEMRMPRAARAQAASQSVSVAPVFHIDARGAQIGVAEQIEQSLRAAGPGLIAQAVSATDARFRKNLYDTVQKSG